MKPSIRQARTIAAVMTVAAATVSVGCADEARDANAPRGGEARVQARDAKPTAAQRAGSRAAVPLAIDQLKPRDANAKPLTVTSPVFANGKAIPGTYSAWGEDTSPPLKWSGAPAGTKSFLIVVDDPDAAEPKPFVHWLLWNLPATATSVHEGVPATGQLRNLALAKQGASSKGSVGYTGPRPPLGDPPHHYHFQVFALDATLPLEQSAKKDEVIAAAKPHVLAAGSLVGTFEKPAR